jgi:cysteine desulfurase
MRVYLDNAASTPLDPQVLEAMMPYLQNNYGNPSSIHAEGRKAKAAIEIARKTIARLLNASPSEIFFTSGGTEADNTAITSSVASLNITNAITTPIEHHAVLHTLQHLQATDKIRLDYLPTYEYGKIKLQDLEELLAKNPMSLVSLMHGNNEVGTINDIDAIGKLCKQFNAVFHSDTVQTVGHYPIDLQQLNIDFIVGSAHKFHGPKGIGFLYISGSKSIQPLLYGGAQERNMRAGTENIAGIIGMAKALEIVVSEMEIHSTHAKGLKTYMMTGLQNHIADISFNSDIDPHSNTLHHILNVSTPPSSNNDMLLFNLDIKGIYASGGSACASGTDIGSHVLQHLEVETNRGHIRFSFSKYTTKAEIDYTIQELKLIVDKNRD